MLCESQLVNMCGSESFSVSCLVSKAHGPKPKLNIKYGAIKRKSSEDWPSKLSKPLYCMLNSCNKKIIQSTTSLTYVN